nr:hypothetical protein [Roseiarcus fermentans]
MVGIALIAMEARIVPASLETHLTHAAAIGLTASARFSGPSTGVRTGGRRPAS